GGILAGAAAVHFCFAARAEFSEWARVVFVEAAASVAEAAPTEGRSGEDAEQLSSSGSRGGISRRNVVERPGAIQLDHGTWRLERRWRLDRHDDRHGRQLGRLWNRVGRRQHDWPRRRDGRRRL